MANETLVAYQVACELLVAIRDADIDDSGSGNRLCAPPRARVSTSQKPAVANHPRIRSASARSREGKRRKQPAIQIAALAGDCGRESGEKATASGRRLYGLLTGLIRRPP